jgi:hypothetical protein
MAVDERWERVYRRLEEVLGSEEAAFLMERFPPMKWFELATRRDLEQFKSDVDLKLNSLKHELTATFRAELLHQTRTMMFALSTAVVTVGGLAFAAARLA